MTISATEKTLKNLCRTVSKLGQSINMCLTVSKIKQGMTDS